MEKISVIVPIYNVARYLGECIESILHQSYTNLEIILVNDGSTDNSLQVCEQYQKQDPRIKLITEKNHGRGPARNLGMTLVTGDFVLFVDADDTIGPDHIKHLYDNLKQYHSDAAFSFFYRQDDNGTYYFTLPDAEKGESGRYTNRQLLTNYYWTTINQLCARLYKRSLFKNVIFPNETYEDVGSLWKIMFNARRLSYIKIDDYCWRIRQHQITSDNADRRSKFHGWTVNYLFQEERIALQKTVGLPIDALNSTWFECVNQSNNLIDYATDQDFINKTKYRMQLYRKYRQ